MPRRKRFYLPGYPYHIVQRGNNREACFFESENYQFYLELWKNRCKRYGVSVHAYCHMTNHVHFLVSLANCNSSRNRQLIKPSAVILPTEFIQFERQFRSVSSDFSRRITAYRTQGVVLFVITLEI